MAGKQKKTKSNKRLGRPSITSTEARRKQVAIMLRQKCSKAEIAEVLGVSRTTLEKDIIVLQRKSFSSVKEVVDKPAQMLSESLDVWEEAIQNSKIGFHATSHPAQKNAFIRTMISANTERIKVLMDLGILERAPTKQDTTLHMVDGVDVSKASLEELSALVRSLEARAKIKGLDLSLLPDQSQSA